MRKGIKAFLNNPIIQFVGLPGIIAGITLIVTILAKLHPWQVWLAIVFVVGCTIWIINQIDSWRERHTKRLTKYSDKELEEVVRQWLDIPNLAIKRKDTPPTIDYFHFIVEFSNGLPVDVFRQKDKPLLLFAVSKMIFGNTISLLKDEDRQKLVGKIAIEMARLGIQYKFGSKENQFEELELSEVIPIVDDLTGFYFTQKIMMVLRASMLVIITYNETLQELGVVDIKAKVIPESDIKGRVVLYLEETPGFHGEGSTLGNVNILCDNCRAILIDHFKLGTIINAVCHCSTCGSFNEIPY